MVMERFFLNLKMERVWQQDYANHTEVTNDIADYIVGFYNSIRLHSKLGNLSSNAFERESTSKKPIKLSKITCPPQSEFKDDTSAAHSRPSPLCSFGRSRPTASAAFHPTTGGSCKPASALASRCPTAHAKNQNT